MVGSYLNWIPDFPLQYIPGQWALHSQVYSISFPKGPFKDCQHAREAGHANSGIYMIKPKNSNEPMQLWCENSLDPGGWAVIQKRTDGSVNFFRNWDSYKVNSRIQKISRQRKIIGKSDHPSEASMGMSHFPPCTVNFVWTNLAEKPGFVMHNTTGRHVILDSGWEVIYYKVLTEHMILINTLRTTVSTWKASFVSLTNKHTQLLKLFI